MTWAFNRAISLVISSRGTGEKWILVSELRSVSEGVLTKAASILASTASCTYQSSG